MKKHVWTLILLMLSTCTQAAMYLVCHNTPNQVPCEQNAWDVDGEALYFRNNSNAFIGAVNTRNVNNALAFRPGYGWGFRVEASYHFGTGNDFTVNWSDYKKSTSSVDDAAGLFQAGTDYTMRSEFDIVNFEFGQHLDFGEKVAIRMHVGIQTNTLREYWAQIVGGVGNSATTDGNRQTGWGPRAGIEGDYELIRGIAFYAKGALAVLSMKQTLVSNANNVFWGVNETVYNIIPETELSFGGKYYQVMPQGIFTMKVAWEELAYINASFGNASLAWNGISFGLKWLGNA